MKKLLIVDDEDIVLSALKEHLELDGYTVDCASEREEALALLVNVRYDCAIIDLCLSPAHGADTFLEKATPLPEVSQLVARLVGDGA